MMTNRVFFISRRLIAAGCALTVLMACLSFDPQPTIMAAARVMKSLWQDGARTAAGFGVSSSRAVYCLSENISGFQPETGYPMSLHDVFDQTAVAIDGPEAMLAANMHLSFFETSAAAQGEAAANKELDTGEDPLPVSSGAEVDLLCPPVGIYCTHNAESYYPEKRQSRVEGGKGLINQVGQTLAVDIQKAGIKAVFDSTVHDSPDYNLSYANSLKTVKRLAGEGDWSAFIDVHRDAIPDKKAPVVVEVDEKMAAQILIIVGSDQRKPNPDWATNLSFAEKVFKQGQIMYPGLIRGVRIKPGTYNQEVHPPSMLVEIGNEYNSLKEAEYSAQLLAEIICSVIKEGI